MVDFYAIVPAISACKHTIMMAQVMVLQIMHRSKSQVNCDMTKFIFFHQYGDKQKRHNSSTESFHCSSFIYLPLFRSLRSSRRTNPPLRNVFFLRPAPSSIHKVADLLNKIEYFVSRTCTDTRQSSSVQQSEHCCLSLSISLQTIHNRPHLLIYNFPLGIPNCAKYSNGCFHLLSRGRIYGACNIHILSVCGSPALKVEASVWILRIDSVPKSVNFDVRKGRHKPQSLLIVSEILSRDGPNHWAAEDVIISVPIFGHFIHCLALDVFLCLG